MLSENTVIMKGFFIILFTGILFPTTDIGIKGFTISLDRDNILSVTSLVEKDVLYKEIEIKEKTGKNIYLYKNTTCNNIRFKLYLPEGIYRLRTTVKYKNKKIIEDSILLKIDNKNEDRPNNE